MSDQKQTGAFYGTVKIGKRGQVVIPAKVRTDLGFDEGDLLFLVRHPTSKAVILMKIDALKDFS